MPLNWSMPFISCACVFALTFEDSNIVWAWYRTWCGLMLGVNGNVGVEQGSMH